MAQGSGTGTAACYAECLNADGSKRTGYVSVGDTCISARSGLCYVCEARKADWAEINDPDCNYNTVSPYSEDSGGILTCTGICHGITPTSFGVGSVCWTNEDKREDRKCVRCEAKSEFVKADNSKCVTVKPILRTPTPTPKLEYGAEAQCGSCKSGDFVGVDSATVDYCTKNPSACAPLNRKCSKAGFCGSYQAKCAWTDNRPNCMGDGTFCGADSNNCGGKQGMKCCPGLTVQPNGACGCPGSVPTPTPKPPAPVCMSITRDIASPTLGASVRYTCGVSKSATRYEFQYRLLEPNQDVRTARFVPLATVSSSSNISAPLVMNKYGKYTVQCRACNESGCAPFEGGY